MSAELSIVVPTFKERDNVAELVRRLDRALVGIGWEAIFVDDNSPDGTAAAVKQIAARDPRVRCILRVGRRGLAGACIEGILSSSAPVVAVMDADLQHDETVLPAMLRTLNGGFDLVAATRYGGGGSAESFGEGRGLISRLATKMTHRALGTELSDPMSGFFMMRRDRFDEVAPRLSPAGFKILLDIATASDRLRIAEQPYTFGSRHAGESKFNAQVGLEFIGLLISKLSGGLIDPRFIFFALVGALGLLVHIAVLRLALLSFGFVPAQSAATLAAMTSNFFLNNELTYRDRRLKGWSMLRGFVAFVLICSIGALTNVGLASWLFSTEREVWWVAGLAGALMGAFWNYAMSSLFVWRTR
ncbi:MAG: glycosyltransferase family 2 protein [Alphaproteobacteria bacterium]|nr:glycosyltransferase family 2 protein [Alphaproteobacteria bacterium]MBV9694574.1 glycosyltransferase family 2 protein [Alphaproteobacteria bacterium]